MTVKTVAINHSNIHHQPSKQMEQGTVVTVDLFRIERFGVVREVTGHFVSVHFFDHDESESFHESDVETIEDEDFEWTEESAATVSTWR